MDKITRVGVDPARNLIKVHGVDSMERVVVTKAISRQKFPEWFANLAPCLGAMEACSATHYWARKLRALGHEVRLIAPQFAAPYRKGSKYVKHDSYAQRVMAVIGIGPLTASAAVATVGDARLFKNGRQFAAWVGTVPKQKSSGGKTRLGRITKQGNTYLRTLLFQGARSAVTSAHRRTDRLSRWMVQLLARVGWYRTLVAVANKHARILRAILAKGERFDPSYVSTLSTPASHGTASA